MKLPTRRSVLIVADGPSAATFRGVYVPQEVYVIGVNHASIWLPRCDAYITACPDQRQRWVMNSQRKGVRYFAAVPYEYGSAVGGSGMGRPRERNVSFFRQAVGGMSSDPRSCAVGVEGRPRNSTYAALNLACLLGAKRVAVVGLDCSPDPRVSGGVPRGLEAAAEIFDSYDGSAEVVNASPGSPVGSFPTVNQSEALSWIL